MLIPMQPGTESEQRINLLLTIASKLSENTKDALRRHFVMGADTDMCCFIYDLRQPNLARSIKRLNEINHLVEQIKEIDLYHITDLKRMAHARPDCTYDPDSGEVNRTTKCAS